MPKIETYQQQTSARSQGIQQVDTGIITRATDRLAATAGQFGDVLARKQEEDDALEASKKIAEARNHWVEYSIKKREEAPAGAKGYSADLLREYDSFLGETLKNEANPRIKRILESKLGVDFRSALYTDSLQFEAGERVAKRRQDVDTIATTNERMVAAFPDQYGYLLRETEAAIGASGLTGLEREKAIQAARDNLTKTYVESLPPAEQLGVMNRIDGEGGFKAASDVVLANEGGLASIDGASGAPAIYGINRKWHQEAFDEAKRITDEKGEKAGQEYARGFYKREFWDKFGIGSLPKETQTVVFDGVVNHHGAFAEDLVKAAKDGATPEQLIAMRREEYQRLGRSEKYAANLPGWLNRLESVATETSLIKNLPADFIVSQRKKATAVMQTELKQEASKIQDAARLGIEVPRQTIQNMASRAAVLDMPEMADGLTRYAEVQDQAVEFAAKPLDEQRQMLERVREDVAGGNLSNTDVASAYQGIYDEKVKLLQTDPWSYYAQREIVDRPAPLDFNNPDAMAVEFQRRRLDVGKVSGMENGRVTLPLMTAQEIEQLQQTYANSNADQAGSVVTSLSSGLTQEEIHEVAAAIAPKDPKLAVAMSLPPDIAMDMIAGDKTKGEVTESKVRVAANEFLAGYVTDPAQVEQVQSAIYAYYKKLALDAGDVAQDADPDKVEQAITDIMGEPLTFNAGGGESKVFGYTDADGQPVKATKLEDLFTALDDDMLKQLGGGNLPITSDFGYVTAQDIKDKAVFRSAGDGIYTAHYPGLGAIYTKAGVPLELDARKIEDMLKQRGKAVKGRPKAGQNTFMYKVF